MRTVVLLLLSICFATAAWAQQDVQHSIHFWNDYLRNPGAGGLEHDQNPGELELTGFYRNQWTSFEGRPISQSLTGHILLPQAKIGIGGTLLHDEKGAEENFGLKAAANYVMDLGGAQLGLGLQAGFNQKSIDGSKLRAPQGDYEGNLDHRDPILSTTLQKGIVADFGVGAFLNTGSFEGGVGFNHPISSTYSIEGFSNPSAISQTGHLYASARYYFEISDKWELQPSILYKSDFAEATSDFSVILRFKDNIWAGGSFRGYGKNTSDAVSGMFGFNVTDRIKLGYAYDATLSSLANVSNGSHEIAVKYKIPVIRMKPGNTINNLRFISL